LPSDGTANVTRRAVLAGGAVLAASVVLSRAGGSATAATAPLVAPVWSESLRRSFGVAAHPNYTSSVYGNVDAWLRQLSDLGAYYFRGMYDHRLPATLKAVQLCRALGLKWHMLLVPEDWSLSQTELRSRLDHIRDNAADVCIAVEGINEPNHNRDGTRVRSDWAQATVAYQQTIAERVRSSSKLAHVAIVGPSVQLTIADPYTTYSSLARAGISPYQTAAGTHSYPGGYPPQHRLDQRLDWIRRAYGPVRTVVTETGYHDALAAVTSHRPAPPEVAAAYGPRAVLEAAARGCRTTRYELLDDPNPAKNQAEANFGVIECPSLNATTWVRKPEYDAMRAFLGPLRDTARDYAPPAIPFAISGPSTLRHYLVGKSDRSARVLMYLDLPVWDPVQRVRLNAPTANVTVIDRLGPRIVQVGASVTSLGLR
jgi:hypothetical protein